MNNAFFLVLLLFQVPATAILLARLLRGPFRHPPLQPRSPKPEQLGAVSIVVPTLNEAERITPCLAGLSRQSYEVREIIVVDSHSQDGTPELVKAAQQNDPRFRLINDDPLPAGWVGRPWALHTGFLQSSEKSEWILGIDADTQPAPGLVASLLETAVNEQYDLISLSPKFILKHPGELWLQPALLMTLIYRFGAAGEWANAPDRVMANGQCFFCRRSQLSQVGGYTSARRSFCDDVTLAREIATQGGRVGFLDGAKVLKVRMYEGAAETWREWGRSLDLKDAASSSQVWGDWFLLLAVQGLPLPMTLLLVGEVASGNSTLTALSTLGLNLLLVLIRVGLSWAIAPSYDFSQSKARWVFWLSPIADPLAVMRIFLSSIQTPTQWRGRNYGEGEGGRGKG
ncbi:glycosyltransferase [Kovacikia minuta CCNUW1]|uniref:2'-O-glycosyltransferase CruG n=1 Tax=Kovacikia minuta TaxID=2931930 RepID=UPI001CCE6E6F|nr:glycosyltransferase family 2 protein [Kovacikia minuta]UBF27957.1 glycosyltransferase [Kovacikia minuta CCNUW1]